MEPSRPQFFYDSDCGICNRLKSLAETADAPGRVEFVPLSVAREQGLLPKLTDSQLFSSSHLLRPDGSLLSAGDSMLGLMSLLPGGRLPSALLNRAPPGPPAARAFYSLLSKRHSSSCGATHGLHIPKAPPKVERK